MKLEYLDFYAFLSLNLQLIAVTIKNLILFDIGLNVAFAGIIIPTLTGAYRNEHNQNETLLLTEVQSSWLGKASSHQISNRKTFFEVFSFNFRQYGICAGTARLCFFCIYDRYWLFLFQRRNVKINQDFELKPRRFIGSSSFDDYCKRAIYNRLVYDVSSSKYRWSVHCIRIARVRRWFSRSAYNHLYWWNNVC